MHKSLFIAVLFLLLTSCGESAKSTATENQKPNIVMIAIDDLNDWAGVFGGHPQAMTPNIDQLAEKSMVFQKASCPGPVCGPSRSALLSGFRPSTTGVYGNSNNMRYAEIVQTHATLPEYFSKHGYLTISKGKIFHKHKSEDATDHGQWAYDIWEQERGNDKVDAQTLYSRHKGIINGKKIEGAAMGEKGVDLVWGATEGPKEETKDYQTAKWFEEKLQEDYDKPFFMLVGLSKPHLPFVVPQEFYDRYGLDTLIVPEYRLDDLDDILDSKGKKMFNADADFEWIQAQDLHKEVVQAYLAACSYADECAGVVLDALFNSKYADNTIVMLWGDHGWHLGEKLKYRKASLWKESTQLPFIVHVPGMETRQDCFRNVNLLDMYPTLIELCGIPGKELDGTSFVPLLENPEREWQPTLTTRGKGNHSVMAENWHYINYNGDGEELYNLENDPMEFENLARSTDDEIGSVKAYLKSFLPEVNAEETVDNKALTKEHKEIFAKMGEERDLSALK